MLVQASSPQCKTLSKQRSFSYPKLSLYFLTTSVTILILLQIQALKLFLPSSSSSSSSSQWHHQDPTPALTAPSFLPLKDLRFANTPMDGNTWFMSSLNDTQEAGEPKHLLFPSEQYDNKILCVSGHNASNGTGNYYALVSRDSLPLINARMLPGLTFVSDTYYDYENLFHGLTAVVPFVAWHQMKNCVEPARWVLYHWGELRRRMGPWVANVVRAVFGENTDIETFEGVEDERRPSCFESAVVFRHNEGSMSQERKEEVYGMIRCKARAYCDVKREGEDERAVRLTLLLRNGPRSFKDEAAVIRIFDEECKKVEGCRLKVERPNNLTFCDQVKLMGTTDILASAHGAQMTNMFFMDKNSSIMEFFPKGWLELAGPGQYVFQWIATSAGLRHKGTWNDPDGEPCPDVGDPSKCFSFYKGGRIGYDEKYFAKWASDVIREMREYKLSEESRRRWQQESSDSCQCS